MQSTMEATGQKFRIMEDSMGKVEVPYDRLYGPQTERARRNFRICHERDKMPSQLIYALAMIKEVAAEINVKHESISQEQGEAIAMACVEVYSQKHDDEFPLSVWQTGSGTQTNMNVNEVIANRANEILTGSLDGKRVVHPNDHVNCGQSSNDIIPTAMNVAIALETAWRVIIALETLMEALQEKSDFLMDVVKIGRTHMQDAVPISVGQEISAYVFQLRQAVNFMKQTIPQVCQLAVGGTAVGTGLNCVEGFDKEICDGLTQLVGKRADKISPNGCRLMRLTFQPAENKFAALAAHDALVQLSGCFNTAATVLYKIANDFVLLSSGPNCGLGEYLLPPNEPGSSIMPGKVNPTQCESLNMVSLQVMGNHMTVSMAASRGQLQLNVYKPIIAMNMLHSCQLLHDASLSFTANCVRGLEVNRERIRQHLQNSVMLVTCLTPRIGYDNAAKIANLARSKNLTLRDAAILSKLITEEEYDETVRPEDMAFPFRSH
ncbi:unnamed protein product [Calicophoron daubneyi]|uniref:fumarate hydratase n=1 Tax=Calicophoron daubneyi TaxID=300641 RepID=A0AAV2TZG5_CALDB